jgi:hypothetical protein
MGVKTNAIPPRNITPDESQAKMASVVESGRVTQGSMLCHAMPCNGSESGKRRGGGWVM